MTCIKEYLLRAFQEDHAVLSGGFGNLASALRDGTIEDAVGLAQAIDRKGGAHIAFEEFDFYTKLEGLLGRFEVAALYAEHQIGFQVIRELSTLEGHADLALSLKAKLLADAERMERHNANCSTLFQAMAALAPDLQDKLLIRLHYWRRRAPSWCDVVACREREKKPGG